MKEEQIKTNQVRSILVYDQEKSTTANNGNGIQYQWIRGGDYYGYLK